MKMSLQRGSNPKALPLWLRLFGAFCIGLITLASTVQVCHAHTDAFENSIFQGAAASHPTPGAELPGKPGTPDTGVNCPLCVAMHSALPVAAALPQMALLELAAVVPTSEGVHRTFSWRFDLASRPPPARGSRA